MGCPTVFFDIDGTLAWRDPAVMPLLPPEERELSPLPSRVVTDAIVELVNKGGHALLCTGRSPAAVHPMLTSLPFIGMVCLSGAYVELRGTVLRDVCMPTDLLRGVDRVLRAADRGAILEGTWGVSELRGGPEGTRDGTYGTMGSAVAALRGARVHKLVVANEVAGLLMAEPRFAHDLRVSRLDELNSEIGYAENTKQVGVRTVLDHLGTSVGTTYAFGDSENDISLFETVDVPVAMGNAPDEVKLRARHVCDSVDKDGVVQGLRELGLI